MSYNAKLRSNNLIRNHEGANAWMQTPEFELYSTVACTMSIDDKFYESGSYRVKRIASLVRMVPAEYVAQLAIYARTEMHLRSVPMLLLVELSQCHSGDSLVSRATAQTIQRVDDITELLACYQWRHRSKDLKHLSNQLRKGIAEAFNKFDEYQFAKYNRDDKKVTLRDALFLVHPKAKDEAQQTIFDKIARNELEIPYTWETQLSQAGQMKGLSTEERQQLKRDTWKELIRSRRMGYMAMLRNLRNMVYYNVDADTMQIAYDYLSNEQAVKNSKQLPFRFFSAYLTLNRKTEEQLPPEDTENQLSPEDTKNQLSPEDIFENSNINPYEEHIDAISYWHRIVGSRLDYIFNTQRYYEVRQRKVCKKHVRLCKSDKLMAMNNVGFSRDILRPWHVAETHVVRKRKTKMRSHLKAYIAYLKVKKRKLAKLMAYLWKLSERFKHRWLKNYAIQQEQKRKQELKRKQESEKSIIVPLQMNNCLEVAAMHSASNIPTLDADTRVCIACDTSGSMMTTVSDNSIMKCYDLALFFGAMMKYRCTNAVTGVFGSTWLPVKMPQDNIMENVMKMRELKGQVGYATNGHKVIEWLIENNKVMDKVMIFTDCQLWNSRLNNASLNSVWNTYKQTVAPEAKLYLFDLAGYGQSPIDMDAERDVYCIAGWSDKVFDMLAAIENGKSVIDEICRIAV